MKYNTFEELKQLPYEVQKEIAKRVGGMWYHTVTVTRENGNYTYLHGYCLKSTYASDYKVWEFDRKTVELDAELNKICLEQDEEDKRWEENEGKNFDWEAFGQ